MFLNTKMQVKNILTEDVKSRCSDKLLYADFIERSEVDGLTSDEKRQLVQLIRKGKLPNYSTVMRSRQYIQASEPELSDSLTARQRKELEEIYRKEFKRYGK